MDKMYFKFVDGRLDRIDNLPKKKDGYSYFIVETEEGIPSEGRVATIDDFDSELKADERGNLIEDEEKKKKVRKPLPKIEGAGE